jgi:hypothetical protein
MTRRQLCLAGALAAPMKGQNLKRFHGSWTLTGYEQRKADGAVTYPMGKDPVGRIAYDATGHMSAQLMRRDRPKFTSGSRQQGTPEEIRAAYYGYVGYYGLYDVDEAKKIVTHHVECCSFPNWVGTDLVRHFEFDGDRLILRVGSLAAGDASELRLTWLKTR